MISDFKFIIDTTNEEFIIMVNLIPIILLNRLRKYTETLRGNIDVIQMIESKKNNNERPANNGS